MHRSRFGKLFEPQPTATRIVVLYVVFGALWVASSNALIVAFVRDPRTLTLLQTFKGWLYVAVTAALLYAIIRWSWAGIWRSRETLRATIDNMADGVMAVDADFQVRLANRSITRMLGYSSEKDVLIPLRTLFEQSDIRWPDGSGVPWEEEAVVLALRGEVTRAREGVIKRPSGERSSLSVSAAPVRDEEGNVVLAVAVFTDISEARRLEAMREQFLETTAHEMKTPITTIKGYVQLLEGWVAGDPDSHSRSALRVINRQCDRMDRMVQDQLLLARLRLGRLEMHREQVDLCDLVVETVGEARAVHDTRRFLVNLAEDADVLADRRLTSLVLDALLDNAVRYSPEGEVVIVTVEPRANDIWVSVADDGIGVPADQRDKLFRRFHRAHEGTRHDYGGLGIGLFISHQIIVEQGGEMRFAPREERGAVFSFSLPRFPKDTDVD